MWYRLKKEEGGGLGRAISGEKEREGFFILEEIPIFTIFLLIRRMSRRSQKEDDPQESAKTTPSKKSKSKNSPTSKAPKIDLKKLS